MSAAATTAIKAERRHEAILRDLVGQIVSGTIPAASRVPYESELAAHYAVSRTVARDAVQRLAVFGLVDVRRRSGAIVTPPERWNMLEPVVLDAAISGKPTAAFFFALFEARLMLEPEAAALAAVRIGAAALDSLAAALTVMRGAPSEEAFVAADLSFHTTMLQAAGNWVLRQFAGAMQAALLASIRLTRAHSPSLDRSADMHDQVLSAIRAGEPDRSRAAMTWLLFATRLEAEAALREDPP